MSTQKPQSNSIPEQGDLQLAPRGETSWNHSVSIRNGQLILYWEERNAQGEGETHSRTFSNSETEVLMIILYDNRDHIYDPDPARTRGTQRREHAQE